MKKPTVFRNMEQEVQRHLDYLESFREPLEAAKIRFTQTYFEELNDPTLARALAHELAERFGFSGNILWVNICEYGLTKKGGKNG